MSGKILQNLEGYSDLKIAGGPELKFKKNAQSFWIVLYKFSESGDYETLTSSFEVTVCEWPFLVPILILKIDSRTVFPMSTKNNKIPRIIEKIVAMNETPFSSKPAASISPSQT